MDQSLRTVATQLLNVTNPEENTKIADKKPVEKKETEASLIKEINSEISNLESMGVGFGRPMNSKFGYFENSHPGQAMAITEEELEKEMSSTRLMTAYKNHPTTTGGISTWILLNPPSSTAKTIENEKKKQSSETETRVTLKPVTTMERVETTEKIMEKLTSPVITTLITEEVTSSTKKPIVTSTRRTTTDSKPEKSSSNDKSEAATSTTSRVSHTTASTLENKEVVSTISTTKKVQIVRTTPKPKISSSSKVTVLSKPSGLKTARPNQQARPKPATRRTTMKPEIAKNDSLSTGKIEKVTFRPVPMITTQKSKAEVTEKPMFVSKIKASILMDTQKTTSSAPASSTSSLGLIKTSNSNITPTNLLEVPVKSKPIGTKVNNVLKVQLKKPLEEPTKIEIEPIKVNAPILTIEKLKNAEKEEEKLEKETEELDNSKINLKFDFIPELTKINVETSEATSATTTTTTTTTTTKRPRQNSKRKKNKIRRRKPSTTTTTTTTVSTMTSPTVTENEFPTEVIIPDVGIQESKIEPESKIANSTKTKKKPVQKPISTQIYNFLSREVMPSFGVMSLVGLGLGLASYFLYPFGGTISRRNYELEPKYKYNLDEYGGNYGQSEEEVLSKVLQGMITEENKYPDTKEYDNNYYRYQYPDGTYDSQTTKKSDQRHSSSSPMYRPENPASVLKYRNTDYRYPDGSSTPNYYSKSKHPDYMVGSQEMMDSVNRQFVVGNVPKEYPSYNDKNPALSTDKAPSANYEATESNQAQFDHDIPSNFNFPLNVQNYGHPEAQTTRTDDGYEEIEITPSAVAVEHGPRSLKKRSLGSFTSSRSSRLRSVKDSLGGSRRKGIGEVHLLRSKRDSVIQVIPSKRELEEEEKEENLSNEILDIIDAALPGEKEKTKNRREDNEVEDLEAQNRKKQEEEKTRLKESTMKIFTTETIKNVETSTQESTTSSSKEEVTNFVDTSNTSSVSSESSMDVDAENETTSKSTEENNVEWIDLTTKRPDEENGFNLFSFVKKVAEIKFRLGLTLLKHASEGFARYLGHVQKRINGEE